MNCGRPRPPILQYSNLSWPECVGLALLPLFMRRGVQKLLIGTLSRHAQYFKPLVEFLENHPMSKDVLPKIGILPIASLRESRRPPFIRLAP